MNLFVELMTGKTRLFTACMAASAFLAPASASAATCESISTMTMPHTTINFAHEVAAGAFTLGPVPSGATATQNVYAGLPSFCHVEALLKPVPGSQIKIEVWLPDTGWNGKFEAVGNGAFAGRVSYPAMAKAIAGGYATASTDTGHSGWEGAEFIPGHPEWLIDFAYRAIHEMTVAAKGIIAARYGDPVKYAYFNGCSTGGRQALAEVQRYPNDFDGIISGDPASYTTHMTVGQLWVGQAVQKDPASFISQEKFVALHNAALAACDANDGVKDGVIENPLACHFDPATIECKAGDDGSCLTHPQVEAARKIYGGAKNPRTGEQIYPGLEPGSENVWGTFLAGRQYFAYAVDSLRYEVFADPKWNPATLNFDSDVARADKTAGATMNFIDPNLKPFFSHGGKLLMYHGWSDPGVPPENTVNYYNSVAKVVGPGKIDDSMRLFMVPGMYHCAGGPGTDVFDPLEPLDAWVTKMKVPASIPAAHKTAGVVDRTRPLCPYPQVAVYSGTGSTDEAANFSCQLKK